MTEAAKMTEKYADLRSLAEAATPGPWEQTTGTVWIDTRYQVCCGRGYEECCGNPDIEGGQERIAEASDANAAFIAAANPAAVLALLDERASHLKALEGAKAVLEGDDPHDGNRADVALDVIDAALSPLQEESK